MQSLIVVNQRVERERRAQLMDKIASELMQAQKKQMPLKQQYLISISNMKLQLHALKLSIGAQSTVGRRFKEELKPTLRSSLRAEAQSFSTVQPAQPRLVSDTSSDTESEPSSDTSCSSSSEDVACDSSFDCENNSFELHEERKRALIGKTVVGRFKIFSPESGVTRYYLNWSSNKNDNIRLSAEVLEKSIGLDKLQSGVLMKATIAKLGPDYIRWDKQNPLTDKVTVVNRNGGNRNQRKPARKPRTNSGGQRKQTRKIGRTTYR